MENNKEQILQKRKSLIANLEINFGIKAIDVYLDAFNEYKRMLREYYVKYGVLNKVDELSMTYTFLSMFYRGHLEANPYYDNHWAAECILYAFYVELIKKGQNSAIKPTILNILASNGSKQSEVYRLILNDKVARNKQEKLEEDIKRVRHQQVSFAV